MTLVPNKTEESSNNQKVTGGKKRCKNEILPGLQTPSTGKLYRFKMPKYAALMHGFLLSVQNIYTHLSFTM